MKLLSSLMLLSLSFATVAGESRSFTFDGSQNTVEFTLKGEKTHTEYKNEEIVSTCYNQEIVGYTQACMSSNYRPYPPGHPGAFPGGYYDSRNRYRHPGPGWMGSCAQQPIYRRVPYNCMKLVRTAFQVKDYDVEAKVVVDISKTSSEAAAENFKVSLKGDVVTLEVKGSKKFLVVQTNKEMKGSMNGSVKMVDAKFTVELVEAAPITAAMQMSKLSVEEGVLSFKMGPVAARENIALSLNILNKKSDTVLFTRELTAQQTLMKSSQEGSEVSVNLPALGVELKNGKFSLTARAAFKPRGALLNRADFPDGTLEVSRTLSYKIR